jgi:flagellar hook-associated protein 3 FlgL
MAAISLGDMAQAFLLRSRNHGLKTTLTRLTSEVATGQVADPAERLSGHYSYLSQIERDRILVDARTIAAKEVTISSSAMQTSLERIGDAADDLVQSLSLSATTTGEVHLSIVSANARGQLENMIAALNVNVAGRHLFSGTDVTAPALTDAETLMNELRTALSGATTQADLMAAADAFFDAPGGTFETMIYQGSTTSLTPVQLGSGESVNLDIRADDQSLRDLIKHVAIAALIDDPALSISEPGRKALPEKVLGGLLGAKDDLVSLRANLGFAEERIDRASSRLGAEDTALQLARNTLLEADPYDAATELEAVRLQIETLYTVTARTSRLSLVNFLS